MTGVAIIGMSCMYPGAKDLSAFWQNIVEKADAVTDPPEGSWDAGLYLDEAFDNQDKVYVRRGGYISDLAEFDPLLHGIPPVSVGGEPDQWLALQLATDALADAGCSDLPAQVRHRTAIVLGKGTYLNGGNAVAVQRSLVVEQTLRLLERLAPSMGTEATARLREELQAALPPISPETVAGLIPNVTVGRIANRLDLMGPCYTVDAACASSLVALQLAVRDLRSGDCDLALAGGSQVWMPVPALNVFCRLGALSRSQMIRPFDEGADGTLLGEGIGLVVLKRLEDALRDGNRVYAVVRGVGVASDGRGVGVMAPRVEGEVLALRRAYDDAGVDPATVGLIEAHGTATPVGDVVEVTALHQVFGDRRGDIADVALGSVKSMISHTIPAAGIAGVIKSALALHHRVLPPTLHVSRPNPKLGLDETPFYLNSETRPWVHGGSQPRRAGVNAFGFGGINAHAVLEERPDPLPARHPAPWDSELIVLERSSRYELVGAADALAHSLPAAAAAGVPLADVASVLARQAGRGDGHRLAIVALSLEDLREKVERAVDRLRDPSCHRLQSAGGVYYTEQPLAREGTLAFLFPGEGAQYPGMVADLCHRFAAVGSVFDRADRRGLADGGRLSQYMFPPSAYSAGQEEAAQERLARMDVAIDAVLTANAALLALVSELGLRPDACVGHSSGEYSAALAAGVLDLADDAEFGRFAARLQRCYVDAVASPEGLPTGVLVSLGTDRGQAEQLVGAAGGGMTVAMDNCPHQAVVVGDAAAAERLVDHARRLGIVHEQLRYDRVVHTPAFAPYADRLRDVMVEARVGSGSVPLWCCATAAPYPAEPGQVRELFVDQWVAPVEFVRTVEAMYDSGSRLFLEVGPRGNLSSFVDDILRGRRFAAVPIDVQRRSGTRQLNAAIALMYAQGVDLDVPALTAGRHSGAAVDTDWQATGWQAVAPVSRTLLKLGTGWPALELSDAALQRVLPAGPAAAGPATDPAQLEVAVDVSSATVVVAAPASAAGSTAAVHDHLATMSRFLDVSGDVMLAYLGVPSGAYPLLGTVVAEEPGVELIARREFSLRHDHYLRDHAFGGSVSAIDAELTGLAVMPLTMSLEIMAEAAARLVPDRVVTGFRSVSAHRWLTLESTVSTLEVRAVRLEGEGGSDVVAVTVSDGQEPTAVEAVVLLAPGYPAAPPGSAAAGDDVCSVSDDLYGAEGMFHGPSWQGVAAVGQVTRTGCSARLRLLPTDTMLAFDPRPAFQVDPVALDAAGQVVGFWAAEQVAGSTVVFPFRVGRIDLFGPPRLPGEELSCELAVRSGSELLLRSDLDVRAADGSLWIRIADWEDKRFPAPERLVALLRPRPFRLSHELTGLYGRPDGVLSVRLDLQPPADHGFWTTVWATRVFDEAERDRFRALGGDPGRRFQHLAGRTAAKEAVCALVLRETGIVLLPADVVVEADADGRPHVGGVWTEWLPVPVQVSIAHTSGIAVAMAGLVMGASRVGIDVELIGRPAAAFAGVAFSAAERLLLDTVEGAIRDEWALRLWSAKEAVGKAVGLGLPGPDSVSIVDLRIEDGTVVARPEGRLAAVAPELAAGGVVVRTTRDGDVVVAMTTGVPVDQAPGYVPEPSVTGRGGSHAG